MMNNQERTDLSKKIKQVIQNLQNASDPWVDFARIGAPLVAVGVQYKQYGFPKLRQFLNEFQDILEFKDVQPNEGKPPVCYVRLKSVMAQDVVEAEEIEIIELKCDGITTSNLAKPSYQNGKSPLWALGFVNDIKGAVEHFARRTGVNISQEELECKVKTSYDNGDILYFEYDAEGNPVECNTYSDKTAIFAINTGVQDSYQNNVFAQYSKGSRGWVGVFFNTKDQILCQMNTYKIGKLTFKDYASANDFIKKLHDELLPGETWKYAKPAQMGMRKKTEYQILESYLRTVFEALIQEYDKEGSLNYGKIKFSKDNNYALFNTGLLSKFATDIYVIGEVYSKKGTTYSFYSLSNPVMLTGGITELGEKGFDSTDADVDMVSFFDKVSQLVYDATAKVDTKGIMKLRHCIEEGIMRGRFPKECKELYDNNELEKLTGNFIQAIERSEKIARRNYKYVVPQYRTTPTGNKIQFLMPIYMSGTYDKAPDFALVLSESVIRDQKYYKPETVLELAWAYNNARVICKPDDMWLNPARIEDVEDLAIDE